MQKFLTMTPIKELIKGMENEEIKINEIPGNNLEMDTVLKDMVKGVSLKKDIVLNKTDGKKLTAKGGTVLAAIHMFVNSKFVLSDKAVKEINKLAGNDEFKWKYNTLPDGQKDMFNNYGLYITELEDANNMDVIEYLLTH